MLEILQFVLKDFWTFLGALLLLMAASEGLARFRLFHITINKKL